MKGTWYRASSEMLEKVAFFLPGYFRAYMSACGQGQVSKGHVCSHHRHDYHGLTPFSLPRDPWSRPLLRHPKLALCSSSQCRGFSQSTWLKRCVSPSPNSGQTGVRLGLGGEGWGGMQAPQAARRDWSHPRGPQGSSPALGSTFGCGLLTLSWNLPYPGTWQFRAQVLLREIWSFLSLRHGGGDFLVRLL